MKTECPLCRQPYSAIIYDVQSEYDFKELKISKFKRKQFLEERVHLMI